MSKVHIFNFTRFVALQLLAFELAGMAMWHIGVMGSGFIPLALDLVPFAGVACLSPLALCLPSCPKAITTTKDQVQGTKTKDQGPRTKDPGRRYKILFFPSGEEGRGPFPSGRDRGGAPRVVDLALGKSNHYTWALSGPRSQDLRASACELAARCARGRWALAQRNLVTFACYNEQTRHLLP